MAIIKCSRCGHDISDKAEKCIFCGIPISESVLVPVHFRRKRRLRELSAAAAVIVDGQPVGWAGNGAEFDIMLVPGKHSVALIKALPNRGNDRCVSSKTIDIPKNVGSAAVEIKVTGGLFGGELVIGDITVK